MAALRDCPGCAWGDHEKHDPQHGVIPGLIGGSVCVCSGDCPERLEREREAWLAKWVHPFAEGECAPPAGCGCSCHQPGGMAVEHFVACCDEPLTRPATTTEERSDD
jgi:hypothetical protein